MSLFLRGGLIMPSVKPTFGVVKALPKKKK